jgi:2-polyprenyl-3-methyl-5-hydroxy-6-metoxy-1,4-benzoquinol methylase
MLPLSKNMPSPLLTKSAAKHEVASSSPALHAVESRNILACPACRSRSWAAAAGVRGVPLSRCTHCGLLGTTHFVTGTKTTDDLYDVDAQNFAEFREQYLPHRLELYARFMPYLEPFRETGRLLEIGSGYGYFLEMAGKAGWKSEGVEISPYCCQVARQRGCRVWEGDLANTSLNPATYDVVVLWDVIEHFTQPDEMIRDCRALLRPGGALVMRTPDARALAHTVWPARLAYRHLVYPANTAEHVFHFTPRDLVAIATQAGFRPCTLDDGNRWTERVISGNNRWVMAARWLIMRFSSWRAWPYEFVLTAVKAE